MSENRKISILREFIQPITNTHAVDLIDIELSGSARSQVLRVFVDTDSGIRLEQCERISRDISDVLDQKDVIPNRYRLEVSSPGLDRPLKNKEDFSRQIDRKVKISYTAGEDNIKKITGRIHQVNELSVYVETDNETINIAFANILLAKIVPVC